MLAGGLRRFFLRERTDLDVVLTSLLAVRADALRVEIEQEYDDQEPHQRGEQDYPTRMYAQLAVEHPGVLRMRRGGG